MFTSFLLLAGVVAVLVHGIVRCAGEAVRQWETYQGWERVR